MKGILRRHAQNSAVSVEENLFRILKQILNRIVLNIENFTVSLIFWGVQMKVGDQELKTHILGL